MVGDVVPASQLWIVLTLTPMASARCCWCIPIAMRARWRRPLKVVGRLRIPRMVTPSDAQRKDQADARNKFRTVVDLGHTAH